MPNATAKAKVIEYNPILYKTTFPAINAKILASIAPIAPLNKLPIEPSRLLVLKIPTLKNANNKYVGASAKI